MRSGFSASEIFTHYYIGFIPHIIALLFPLFVFIAVIFFTSKMAGQTEIIAILASGTSYNRWLRPYLIGGVFLGLFLWISNLYFIPKANIIRGSFEAAYVDAHSSYNALITTSPDVYFRIDSFTYAGIYGYDTANNRGRGFFTYRVEKGKLIVAGPLGKNDQTYRGIFILNVTTFDEAKSLLQNDTAIKEGLLDFDLFKWYGSAALPDYLESSDKIWKVKP